MQMNTHEIKLTKAGAVLPKKEEDLSNIVDVSHETGSIYTQAFYNPLKDDIPVLTETIDDAVIKSLIPVNKPGKIPDFSTERILQKNYRALNLIEQSFHSDITLAFQQAKENSQWLSFWSLLNQVKHQNLFFSDYYVYWLMKVLSSNNENAYKSLALPFIWKNICVLDNQSIFELVKPTFEVLYYSKSLNLLFYLTESLLNADVKLPQEWLTDLTKFDYVNNEAKGRKTFAELLARNSNNI